MTYLTKNIKFNHEALLLWLYTGILVLLPFSRTLSSFLLGFSAFFIILYLVTKKIRFQLNENSKLALLPHLYYIFIFLISLFWTENKTAFFNVLGRQITIIIIPLVTIAINEVIKENNLKIFSAFILSNIITLIILYLYAIIRHFFYNTLPPEKSYFHYIYFSTLLHPTFFSMYLNFSIIFLFYIFEKISNRKAKIIISFTILFLAVSIIQVSSRSGILFLAIILTFFSIKNIFKIKKIKIKLLFLTSLSIIILLIINNPRFKTLINEVKNPYEKNKNHESRGILMKNAMDVFLQNIFIGTSPADAQNELDKNNILKYKYYSAAEKHFNAHNQILQNAVEFGILGILFFISYLIIGFYIAIKEKNSLLLWFMILVFVYSMFETPLNCIAGILFITIFYNLLIIAFNRKEIEKQTENFFNKIKL